MMDDGGARVSRGFWMRTTAAVLLTTAAACSHPPVAAAPAPAAPTSAKPGPTRTNPTASSELAAYCGAADKRRAAFRLELSFEVRAASLLPRSGYVARPLAPEEQSIAGQSQIFVGPGVVTAADLGGGEIWRDQSDSGDASYNVSVRVKSASALAPRLQPLVGGSVAVLVDGRLILLPRLKAATVAAWPVAVRVTLAAARSVASRLGPPADAAALQHLEERCLSGQATLCLQLAEERLLGRDAPYDAERALVLFEAGCRAGVGAACKRAAELVDQPQKAAELLESGCRLNDAAACLQTAARLLHRPGAPDALARGKAILKRSCDGGAGSACMALADELSRDFSGDAPPPLEAQQAWLGLIERGCAGGDAEACFTRAGAARKRLFGDADAASAPRWLHAGCLLDPSGGSAELEVKFAGADPALLEVMKEAGCIGDPPRPTPPPSLCASAAATR